MSSDTEKTTLQRLMELKDLYESELITKEEMEAKKRQILGTDNPSVDKPNGEIENEVDCEIPNQAEDGYEPDKFCSPTQNVENVEQLESNNEQGNEENKGSDTKLSIDGRKIFKLSLIVAAVVVVIVVLAIILTPTDYNDKVANAIEKYKSQNATILSSSGTEKSTKDNHYVIFQKGDTIYIDELERKTLVRAILPRKGGFFIKRLFLTFENEKPTASCELVNEGKRSNLQIRPMLKVQYAYEGKRAICLKEMKDGYASRSYYYNMNNPDTIYMVDGEFVERTGFVSTTQHFSFGELEYVPGWWEYSLYDYIFELSSYYNIDDMRFHHFGEYCIFEKDDYPMDLLTKEFSNQNFDYGFPSKWFGTSNMDKFINCLKRDADRKTNQANLNRILSQTIDFDNMCNEFNTNPVNAARLYPVGKRMYLAAKVNKIDYSQRKEYKYILFSTRDDDNCYIHTNDERFASINYPTTVLVEVEFEDRFRHEGQDLMQAFFGELFDMFDYQIKYIFKDAELISYEGYKGDENYYDDDDYYEEEGRQQSNSGVSQFVVIDGAQLRLRLAPSTSSDTFKWPDGTNRHPNVGDKYRYLGESGDFYKIDFNGNELWVSKQYTHLE